MIETAKAFQVDSEPISCLPHGHGHINETFLIATQSSRAYILQRINHHVFRDVPALMHNILAVTQYLAERDGDPRHVLSIVPTQAGETFFVRGDDTYWRMYACVTDSICLDRAETAEDFYQSGVAFGQFQKKLSAFPADTLYETIPRFHDTPNRFRLFHEAIEADVSGRAKAVRAEIEAALAHEAESGIMISLQREGRLPIRVTHNDTKLNNVMLDKKNRQPLCVVDLDTVMPGLVANDFGDAIRYGASTAPEDEKNLSLVTLSLPLYEAFSRGFLGACGSSLTALEIETLPLGAKLMTLECGVRFLTDYLAGDTYFRTSRAGQNLDRCRTHVKLVQDMEQKWDEMNGVIASLTSQA